VRVTIRHRQEDGFLPNKKLHYVDCTVLFSEEEKAIIETRGLGRHYIVTDSEVPPPSPSQLPLAKFLKVISPIVFLGGCVTSLGMAIAGHHRADAVAGISFFAALALLLGGIALKRHAGIAEQPKQTITLGRLLTNPTFSAYTIDNARAKLVDEELRETLTRLKEGLLVNRDIKQAETFEL
jgi:hypothetical protein